MTITQALSLDVARESVVRISAKQFDKNSRYLLITVLESGQEQSIPSASTITLNGRRPDGSSQSFLGEVQDGKAYLKIDDYLLEQYGTVYCSVSIIGSDGAKLSTLSFRMVVERAESTGWVLMYTAPSALSAGTYHINVGSISYQFTLTQALPVGGCIYFASDYTGAKTVVNGADVETLTLTVGTGGTELIGSDVVNFLTQISAEVSSINEGLESKADKSAIEENLAAGTSLATIDPNSYAPSTSPYLYRQSPSGKRCEYDVIGGTVGWNQLVQNGNFADGTNEWRGFGSSIEAVSGELHIYNGTGNYVGTSTVIPWIQGHRAMLAFTIRGKNGGESINMNNNAGTNTQIISSLTTSKMRFERIFTPSSNNTTALTTLFTNGQTNEFYLSDVICIDLTTLLGSTIADYAYTLEQATAGSGIAWLKSFGFLTKSYYPFSEPTLESVQATARVARGINQWDEEWASGRINITTGADASGNGIRSTNYISVIPSTAYRARFTQANYSGASGIVICYYDDNKNYLGYENKVGASVAFATLSNAQYIKFNIQTSSAITAYGNDICINLSNPTINGQYFPYESHTYPLGNTTLRGIPKLDSNNNIYYDGDVYKADGTITRRRKSIDLGTLNYRSGTPGIFYSNVLADTPEFNESTLDPKVINTKYLYSSSAYGSLINDKVFCINGGRIWIVDTAYSDVAIFKSAMSGVMFEYPLATPTTESTDPFTPIQYTGSTEEFTTSNDVPVGVDAKYYTDLTLPKLPTANGTYTLKCTVTDGTGIVSWVSE